MSINNITPSKLIDSLFQSQSMPFAQITMNGFKVEETVIKASDSALYFIHDTSISNVINSLAEKFKEVPVFSIVHSALKDQAQEAARLLVLFKQMTDTVAGTILNDVVPLLKNVVILNTLGAGLTAIGAVGMYKAEKEDTKKRYMFGAMSVIGVALTALSIYQTHKTTQNLQNLFNTELAKHLLQ